MGNPEYGVELQNIDFALAAQACGLHGSSVDRAEGAARAVAQTLAQPGPALLEATTDLFEPLMPGSLKPEQAEKITQALKNGEPNAPRIGITLYRDAIEDPNGNLQTITEALGGTVPGLLHEAVSGERHEVPREALRSQAQTTSECPS